MRRVWAGLLLLAVSAAPVRAERLVVSLSANEIAIGSNYTGARLSLYGIIERDDPDVLRTEPTDVVVTVRGPRDAVTVRQKERVGPVWINRSQQKFVAVPAVLGVASSRPVAEIATEAVRTRLRLGIRAIVDAPEMAFDAPRADDPFREALIRLKTRDGLWRENGRGVVFVTRGFFRAAVDIPGTAPTGNYDVEIAVLSGSTLLGRRNASFEVVKSGFEEQVTSLAQEHSALYALAIAGLSLGFGWIASVIFRRD